MILLRMASGFVFMESPHTEDLKRHMMQRYEASSEGFHQAVQKGDEASTLVFLFTPEEKPGPFEQFHCILRIQSFSSQLLARLFNDTTVRNLTTTINMGPQMLLMRYLENPGDVLKSLQEDYPESVIVEDWKNGIRQGIDKDSTVLALCSCSLSHSLAPENLYQQALLIPAPGISLVKQLSYDAMAYVTHSLSDKEWQDMKITIYDSEGNTKKHYERLVHSFSALDAGFIIGESWSQDHPFVLLTVYTFQIDFLTLYSADEMKKILMGLEYDSQGNRRVDFDLFIKNKKVSWTRKALKPLGKSRAEIGIACRRELTDQIPESLLLQEHER